MKSPFTGVDVYLPAPGIMPGVSFQKEYAKALCAELESAAQDFEGMEFQRLRIFGGGNLPDDELGKLLRELHKVLHILPDRKIVCLEPHQLSTAILTTYRNYHMSLYELDLGSLNIIDFRRLGRPFSYSLFGMLAKLFRYFEMDQVCPVLYYALSGQNQASLEDSLQRALSLTPNGPDAIRLKNQSGNKAAFDECCYAPARFDVEEETPGAKTEADARNGLDAAGSLYEHARVWLTEHGYSPKAGGLFVKDSGRAGQLFAPVPGWKDTCFDAGENTIREEILGLGLGAVSVMEGCRARNTQLLEDYIRNAAFPEKLIVEIKQAQVREKRE